ncbi:MAG: hypothetical protein QMD44_03040 [Thermodesulfovibrionales bacterium]|jgi:flagellar motor protein MotB|nr:hypothetical protein [Thermodesulfovibrionales bacterium]
MKKLLVLVIIFFNVSTGIAADKEKVFYQIEKARSIIKEFTAKPESVNYADDITVAWNYIKIAETEFQKNTNILGKLSDQAVPTIIHYANMAELTIRIALSRLEKAGHEKEISRLEGLISDIKAKIKVLEDKDAEIIRLKKEVEKAKSDITKLPSEISKEKDSEIERLSKEVSALKSEKEELNTNLTSLKKELGDKNKAFEALQTELKYKLTELTKMQKDLHSLGKLKEFLDVVGMLGVPVRTSENGITIIIPRRDFIKITSKGAVLSPGSEKVIGQLVSLIKRFPEYRIVLKVYGFGQPAKNEGMKATEHMAIMVKDALLQRGNIAAEMITAESGGNIPIFPKDAVELNRRVEITFLTK